MIEGNKMIITWCTEDIIMHGKDNGYEITEEQAQEILETADRRHDCCQGINWEVLLCHIEMYDGIIRKIVKA